MPQPNHSTYDVVIIGGAIFGSSVAWWLTQMAGFDGKVLVVERDPTYEYAATIHTNSCIRQQFSSAVNIQLAQYSTRFYAEFDRALRVPGHVPHANFRQRGYLFLVDDGMADRFEARVERQRRLGAHIERLTLDQLRALVPGVRLDDIRFGVFGPDDGYGEPREVLAGFRAAAAAAGAEYLTAEVVGLTRRSGRVAGVVLDGGERVPGDAVVNAAGPFATRLGAMAGIDLPIHIGIAGPAKLQTLIKFAIACGVGPSLKVLQKRAMDVTKLLLPYEPTDVITELAAHKAANPDFNITHVHFFPLGGIKTNANWAIENGGPAAQPANSV